jgi:hypothetical protein
MLKQVYEDIVQAWSELDAEERLTVVCLLIAFIMIVAGAASYIGIGPACIIGGVVIILLFFMS